MNAPAQRYSRPIQVRVLDRCDECGELKEDVQERVNYWPTITAVCRAKCFAELTPVNAADFQPAIEQDSRRSTQVALLRKFFSYRCGAVTNLKISGHHLEGDPGTARIRGH
jgi:hypothetical protein